MSVESENLYRREDEQLAEADHLAELLGVGDVDEVDVVGLAEGGDELAVSLLGASLEEDAEVVHVGHALDTVERARTLAQTTDDVRLAIGLGCVERVTQDLRKRILEAPA